MKAIRTRSEPDPTRSEPDSNPIQIQTELVVSRLKSESTKPYLTQLDQDFPNYRPDLDLIRAGVIQVVNAEYYLQQSIFYSNFYVTDFHNSFVPCTVAVMVLMAMTKISFVQNSQFMIYDL